VSPVKYELGFYIPEDGILHRQHRENLRSYTYISLFSPNFWRRIYFVKREDICQRLWQKYLKYVPPYWAETHAIKYIFRRPEHKLVTRLKEILAGATYVACNVPVTTNVESNVDVLSGFHEVVH
jgi:hypothetical protein